jgi:hypothetical protein
MDKVEVQVMFWFVLAASPPSSSVQQMPLPDLVEMGKVG